MAEFLVPGGVVVGGLKVPEEDPRFSSLVLKESKRDFDDFSILVYFGELNSQTTNDNQ